MSLEAKSDRRHGYLWFDVHGVLTHENLIELAGQIRRECDSAGIHGVIVDCSGLRGGLDPGTLYFAVQECVKLWGPRTHVAYINPPKEWAPEDDRFSRDVAHNFGGSLELFNSAEEAVAWLNERHPLT